MENKDEVGKLIDYYNYVINYDNNDTRKGINKAKENEKNRNKPKITEKGSKKKSQTNKYNGKRLIALLVAGGFSIGAFMATHAAKEKNIDLYEEYLKESTRDLGDEETEKYINSIVEKQLVDEFETAFDKEVQNVELGTTYVDTASYSAGPEIRVEFEDGTTMTFNQKHDLRSFGAISGNNQTEKISEGISKLQNSEGREANIEAAAELLATLNKKDIVAEKDKNGNDIIKEVRGNNSVPEAILDEEER